MELTRRDFLKVAGAAAAAGKVLSPEPAHAFTGKYATIIDITRCDGCRGEPMPRCVRACREYNKPRFPEPVKDIQPYWPHKFYEDWSQKRGVYNAFTPYNWIFLQKVSVEGHGDLYVPRRCMHCDNPPCVSLCPFGALSKEKAGNTVISDALCFGGAKCRDVCPWHVPQRQAGVGLYLKIMPKFAGGGVMYKCDLCKDLVSRGKMPACVAACTERLGERTAMFFGERAAIYETATKRAKEEGLFIYGDRQNGGTSTLYLSRVPFETIDALLGARKERFRMAASVPNPLDEPHNLAKYFLIGSVAGAVAGVAGALLRQKAKEDTSGEHEDTKA